MKTWKPVDEFPGYEVSRSGEVKSLNYNREKRVQLLKPSYDHSGYLKYGLAKNNKIYNRSAHRLVALAFIPNPQNKPCINHKNGIKTDNRVNNLEWCSISENNIHSIKVLGRKVPPPFFKGKKGKDIPYSRPIRQIDKNTDEVVCEFESCTEAFEKTGIGNSQIGKAAKGIQKTAGKFKWEYI